MGGDMKNVRVHGLFLRGVALSGLCLGILSLSTSAGAQALPNYDTLNTIPPTQMGRVNPFIAEVMNRRFDRMGIPANDNRRLETITAMRAQARGIAQASTNLAGAGRAIGWAGAALSAYNFAGNLLDSTVSLQDEPALDNGAPISRVNNQLLRSGLRLAGKAPPELFPGSTSDPTRYFAQQTSSTNVFWGMNVRTAAHGMAVRMQIAFAVVDRDGRAWWPGLVSITAGTLGGQPTETFNFTRPAYRDNTGALQPAINYGIQSRPNSTYNVANGAPPRCELGGAEGTANNYACSVLASIDVEGPIPVSAHDAVRTIPSRHALVPAAQEFIAHIIDRLWADAAAQPGFGGAGASYSFGDPITEAEVALARAARPDLYPVAADLAAPMCASCFGGQTVAEVPIPNIAPAPATGTNPGTNPGTGTNPTPPPVVDLGPDPATQLSTPPETTWESIIDPWRIVPPAFVVASEQCPVFTKRLEQFDRDFTIDQHCSLIAEYQTAIAAAALLMWSLLAFGVFMRA
jgi:hypothetical protein